MRRDEGAVFLGEGRVTAAVGNDAGVGEVLFQFGVAAEGLLEDRPHGKDPLRVG